MPDKPSIVVLPFDNMSKDSEQEYFSNGITEVLTASNSRLHKKASKMGVEAREFLRFATLCACAHARASP